MSHEPGPLMPSDRWQLRCGKGSDFEKLLSSEAGGVGSVIQDIPLPAQCGLTGSVGFWGQERTNGKGTDTETQHNPIYILECHPCGGTVTRGGGPEAQRPANCWDRSFSLWSDFSSLLIASPSHGQSSFTSLWHSKTREVKSPRDKCSLADQNAFPHSSSSLLNNICHRPHKYFSASPFFPS